MGTNEVIIASTAKVPEPCTGTVTCVPCPPASSTILSSTIRLMPRKPASREPQSWTMACLTLAEVVSGPGVSSSGSPVSEAAGLRVVMAPMVARNVYPSSIYSICYLLVFHI